MTRANRTAILEPNIIAEPVNEETTDQTQLVFSGNLINRKRPWIALQALAQPALKDFTLAVVGDGPLRSQLESFTRQERLTSRVQFLGRLEHSEAVSRVASSSILLLPSKREGAGWVVGEAAAAGTPSVVLGNSGAATVVRLSGDMGAVVPETSSARDSLREYCDAIVEVHRRGRWKPSNRWSANRLPELLTSVWR
ncbi:glycosyltransferase [Rhodococcus opacus]|uniref:glycosyltransferase n=1 Tax=Rhodococcus opacus TaxID=37919 RepID=UPI00374E5997